jgi:hypothetical protein
VEPWASTERLIHDLGQGKAVAIVSPELHRKPHRAAWAEWCSALARARAEGTILGDAMLCTDLPDDAAQAFARVGARP